MLEKIARKKFDKSWKVTATKISYLYRMKFKNSPREKKSLVPDCNTLAYCKVKNSLREKIPVRDNTTLAIASVILKIKSILHDISHSNIPHPLT